MASVTYGATGINFADYQTPAAGKSSELLDHYEEGTWTAACSQFTISSHHSESYCRMGSLVYEQMYIGATSGNGSTVVITGPPFSAAANHYSSGLINSGTNNEDVINPHFRKGANSSSWHAIKINDANMVGTELDAGHIISQLMYIV